MERTLLQRNPDINLDNFKIINRHGVVGTVLQRLDQNLSNNAENIQPIRVKKYTTPERCIYVPKVMLEKGYKNRTVPASNTYSITDGRHRVVSAILKGEDSISAIVE